MRYDLLFLISLIILKRIKPLRSIKYLPSDVSLKLVILPKQQYFSKSEIELLNEFWVGSGLPFGLSSYCPLSSQYILTQIYLVAQ